MQRSSFLAWKKRWTRMLALSWCRTFATSLTSSSEALDGWTAPLPTWLTVCCVLVCSSAELFSVLPYPHKKKLDDADTESFPASADDGVDAMCPFCRMDVRDVLNGLHVRCPPCEGLVEARCLAATTSSRSPEVSCPTCPASLGDSVSLDWFTWCHINGVQLLVQDDLGECMLCQEELDVESSIQVPCCSQSLHVTCVARSLTTRLQPVPLSRGL